MGRLSEFKRAAAAMAVLAVITVLSSMAMTPMEAAGPAGGAVEEEDSGPLAGVTLVSEDHASYLSGKGNGLFDPDGPLTRAEAAYILYELLSDTVPVTVSYTDVPEALWYAEAAGELGSLGVIRPEEETFLPNENLTRGEFARYIACFFPLRDDAEQFSDVDPEDENAPYILSGRAWGWLSGYGNGNFGPDDPLTRCEAVALLNGVLGRPGDRACIEENRPALYLDVPVTAWYYRTVMEGTVPHEHGTDDEGGEVWTSFEEVDTGLPEDFRTEGRHLYNGWSYYYDSETKDIVRNASKGNFPFDAEGHFTSGDAEVDAKLRGIVLSQTNGDMTQEDMLKAFFAYCRDTYSYRKQATYPKGDTSFMLKSARTMLDGGKGNCYCFASVFWYLSRWIGYDAQIFSGGLGRSGNPHSWVEISTDGVPYIYDTQLEWRYVHDYGQTSYYWYFYKLQDTKNRWNYAKK